MGKELLVLPEHAFPFGFCGVRIVQSLFLCVVFCRSLFVLFLLAIVLSVLRSAASDFPFGIFKLFSAGHIRISSKFKRNDATRAMCFYIGYFVRYGRQSVSYSDWNSQTLFY